MIRCSAAVIPKFILRALLGTSANVKVAGTVGAEFDAITPTVFADRFDPGSNGARIPQGCKEMSLFSTNRQRRKTDENEKLTFR